MNSKLLVLTVVYASFLIGCTIDSSILSLGSESSPGVAPISPTLSYSISQNLLEDGEPVSLSPTANVALSEFEVDPALPNGLSLDLNSGLISGTPIGGYLERSYTVRAKAPDGSEVLTNFFLEVAEKFPVVASGDSVDINPGDGVCANSVGQCTLRAAIQEANELPPGIKTIIDLPAGTYSVDSSSLLIDSDLILRGSDPNDVIIDANVDGTPVMPAVDVSSQVKYFEISGVTIRDAGSTAAPAGTTFGVGVKSLAENAVFKNCKIINNTAIATLSAAARGGGIYHVGSGDFEMDQCEISNNTISMPNASSYSSGGGAFIQANSVTIRNSKVNNNTMTTVSTGASEGGGLTIFALTSLIENSEVSGNSARNFGGGIYYGNRGTDSATIRNSKLINNTAGNLVFGTAINGPEGGEILIEGTTISQTGSGQESVWMGSGAITIKNSTLFNSQEVEVLEISSGVVGLIESSTLVSQAYPIGFFLNQGVLQIKSSVVRGVYGSCSTSSSARVQSLGYNVFYFSESFGPSCASTSTDVVGLDPMLNALADNGGSTPTMSLQLSSPARNLVPASECLSTDQRGETRPTSGFCDSGATQQN